MPAPLTSADYAAALAALLPRGPAWPRDPDSPHMRLVAGLAQGAASLHARAEALLADAFPTGTTELLPEWETSLGLPDLCVGEDQSTEQRRAGVAARFVGRGGQSVAYFVGVAAAMGFVVTVETFTPARTGLATVGTPIRGDAWAHAWQVHAPTSTVTPAHVGGSVVGDPLAAWGNLPLQCVLARIRPAHTVLILSYGS